MNDQDTTTSYVELSTQSYGILVDAVAASNQRALDYAKSVWDIVSRPYGTSAPDATVRESFDRTNQIVALTLNELQTRGQKSAELAEKLVAQNAKVQESYVHAVRGLMNAGISNINTVKETATQQFQDFSKRLEDAGNRATTAVSNN